MDEHRGRVGRRRGGERRDQVCLRPRPYLGDDMTATLRLWLGEGESPQSPLSRQSSAGMDRRQPKVPHPDRHDTLAPTKPLRPFAPDHDPPSKLSDGVGTTDSRQRAVPAATSTWFSTWGNHRRSRHALMARAPGNTGGRRGHLHRRRRPGWTKRCSIARESKQIALTGGEADLTSRRVTSSCLPEHSLAKRILLGEVRIIGRGSGRQQEQAAAPPIAADACRIRTRRALLAPVSFPLQLLRDGHNPRLRRSALAW